MGTRGFIGFVINGQEKITYNHWDSYPAGLGADVLSFLHNSDLDVVRQQAADLRVVGPDSNPTEEDVERLKGYADTGVSTGKLQEWYVLLRQTQGNPALILEAGVIEDASEFPLDSLFAEWGYIIDFDANVFEVYKGFQHGPHDKGRFASRTFSDDERELSRNHSTGDRYYPCALVGSFPLDLLPEARLFLATVDPNDVDYEDDDSDEDEGNED